MNAAVVCQLLLLAYHQTTTWLDLYPFNGVRGYSRNERLAEAGANAVLMSLAPIGFVFRIEALMIFGVFYYFILFGIELIIWWVPYFTVPSGRWRSIYNGLLSLATSNFGSGDALAHWTSVYQRLHRDTITLLPPRGNRPVPNLEHMILHAWTLVTALVTLVAYHRA